MLHPSRLCVFIIGFILVGIQLGCQTDLSETTESEQTPEVTRELTPLPTEAELTLSVTDALTQEPTPTGPPPSLPEEFPSDFLFGVGASNCVLPCWMGLEVGSSDREQVYSVLDTTLGFAGYRPPPPDHILEHLPDGLDAVSEGWLLEDSSGKSGSFGMAAYFDQETQILEGLAFGWLGNNRFQPNMTIERTLRELGEPAHIFIDISIGGPDDDFHANIEIVILYASGLAFNHFELVPVKELSTSSNGAVLPIATDLCFGDNDPLSTGGVVITTPVNKSLENHSPLQDFLIGGYLAVASIPIEEVADKSLQEITQLAVEQDNACIRLDLEQFWP
jgi:hypothetical protein